MQLTDEIAIAVANLQDVYMNAGVVRRAMRAAPMSETSNPKLSCRATEVASSEFGLHCYGCWLKHGTPIKWNKLESTWLLLQIWQS